LKKKKAEAEAEGYDGLDKLSGRDDYSMTVDEIHPEHATCHKYLRKTITWMSRGNERESTPEYSRFMMLSTSTGMSVGGQ
jgi:hypothetical protein